MLSVIRFALNIFNTKKFRKLWRNANPHNETVPLNIFPINKVKVGKYTYGNLKVETWDNPDERLEIGNYCSIAVGVTFILGGNHSIEGLLTYPSKVKIFKFSGGEAITRGAIIVEDDVWIGTNATILSGVTVGKGSVIGAGAVISKNIEPYSIVVGNPGVMVRKRFPDDVIEYLKGVDLSKLNLQNLEASEVDRLYSKIRNLNDAKDIVLRLTDKKI